MRRIACGLVLLVLGSCQEGILFIPGTATLPACDEAPVTDLSGFWFDIGTVTIRTEGCFDAAVGTEFQSCALNWQFTQDGNDLTIIVDEEYRLNGRLCDDELYLEGGWWLPVEDNGFCEYEDDSADEVGIQAEGNVLTYSVSDQQIQQLTGTLVVQGSCGASYEVTFERVRDPSLS